MTEAQRLAVRCSELRSEHDQLMGQTEILSDVEVARLDEVRTELRSVEAKHRAAVEDEAGAAEVVDRPSADGESAELRHLVSRASIGDVLDQSVFDRPINGATAELQQHRGIGSNAIPLDLFETRAASTVTSGGDAETQRPTIPMVFPTMVAQAMGIQRQRVGVGEHNQPVVTAPTSGPTAATAIGTSVTDTTVTIAGTNMTPSRVQIGATVGRAELATFRGLETEVTRVLQDAISDSLDYQALRSSGGLFEVGTDPTADTADVTFQTALQKVFGAVDGRYANGIGDLSLLLGPDVYAAFAALFIANNRGDQSALQALMSMCRMVVTSANVPAAVSNDAEIVIHRGSHVGIVQPVWTVETIRDPYSLATDGQIRVNVFALQAVATVRAGVYVRRPVQIA